MFYLNRTGAPEGPYEESRLLAMIASGELSYGNICWVGHNQWAPLESHPAFARALAERHGAQGRGAPSPVQPPPHAGPGPAYAPPPAAQPAPGPAAYGAGYGPPPGAQAHGYGPAPGAQAPGYGPAPGIHAPSGSYAGPAAPGSASGAYNSPSGVHSRSRAAGASKSKRLLIIAAIAGIAVVFLIGTAIGAYMLLFGRSAPSISAAVPRDVELFLEIPSFKKSLGDLADVEFIEPASRDDEKMLKDGISSLARAFDISEVDASNLLLSADSAGIGLRKLATSGEGVVVLGFQRSAPVDKLLESKRFTNAGAVGSGGKKYLLARKDVAPGAGSDLTFRALAELEVTGRREVLAWFAEQKLLVFGVESLVLDTAKVIESGAPGLDENPSFQAARKEFPSDARVVGFVDPSVMASIADPSLREIVDGYFKPAGPMTASMQVNKAGFVLSLAGRFMGTKLPKASAYEPPRKLSLPDRLPAEAFAYLALATKSKLSGAEMEKALLEQLQAAEPRARAEIEQSLRQIEATLGVSLAKIIESLGEQAALALLAPADFTLDQVRGPDAFARFAVVYAQELKDEAALKTMARELKTKLLPAVREVTVSDDPSGGFTLTSRALPLPVSLRAKFVDKHLFVAAGATALVERAEAAFLRGEKTLKDDAAHAKARAALPAEAHALLWIDTGRSADTFLKSPLVRAMIEGSGFQPSHFKLTGAERITTAVSARAEAQNETWTYRVDALNLQGIAPFASGAALLAGGGRALAPAPQGLPPGFP